MALFGVEENCKLRQAATAEHRPVQQRRGILFLWGVSGDGLSVHWRNAGVEGSEDFPLAEQVTNFWQEMLAHPALLGPVVDDSSPLRILPLGSEMDRTVLAKQWWRASSPFWPPDSSSVRFPFLNFHKYIFTI